MNTLVSIKKVISETKKKPSLLTKQVKWRCQTTQPGRPCFSNRHSKMESPCLPAVTWVLARKRPNIMASTPQGKCCNLCKQQLPTASSSSSQWEANLRKTSILLLIRTWSLHPLVSIFRGQLLISITTQSWRWCRKTRSFNQPIRLGKTMTKSSFKYKSMITIRLLSTSKLSTWSVSCASMVAKQLRK